MKHTKFILTVFLFISISASAQQTTITGNVTDAETGSAMSYASIRLKEKALGVVANEQGEFTLTLNSSPENFTLVVSFVGFKPFEIRLSEFIKRNNKIIKLEPVARELETVTISEEKFDVNVFMAEVIKKYQTGHRTTPHIARAYFQEQIWVKFKPVLLANGVGYSVYLGDVQNQAARSNYKFFYEQVSVNENSKPWTDHVKKLGKTSDYAFGASDNLNNFRTFELRGPLSDSKTKFKYKLPLDSTLSHQGETCLYIKFKGPGQSGWMIVGEESLQVWMIVFNGSEDIWSNAYNDRVEGTFSCVYDYYEGQHFLSEAHSLYTKGDITHINTLKVVSQKFDTLELSEKEYWAINLLDRFTISQAKASEHPFEPYTFSGKDLIKRTEFTEGFKVLTVDSEKNPDYKELLIKLRSFF